MRWRRRLVLLVVALVVGVAAVGAGPAAGWAAAPPQVQDDETTDDTGVPTQDIVPDPDSGTAPDEAGDRGGALQLAVLGAMVVGIGVIAALVVRESRHRHRQREGARS